MATTSNDYRLDMSGTSGDNSSARISYKTASQQWGPWLQTSGTTSTSLTDEDVYYIKEAVRKSKSKPAVKDPVRDAIEQAVAEIKAVI